MFKRFAIFLTSAVGSVGMGLIARAAADADVLSAGETLASTTKENIFGLVTGNIDTIAIMGALIVGVTILWRFTKRFLK